MSSELKGSQQSPAAPRLVSGVMLVVIATALSAGLGWLAGGLMARFGFLGAQVDPDELAKVIRTNEVYAAGVLGGIALFMSICLAARWEVVSYAGGFSASLVVAGMVLLPGSAWNNLAVWPPPIGLWVFTLVLLLVWTLLIYAVPAVVVTVAGFFFIKEDGH